MKDVYKHLAESVEETIISFIYVTSPLLKTSTLETSIEIYKKLEDKYSSLASVEHLMKYIWFKNKAINYDPKNHPKVSRFTKILFFKFCNKYITKKNNV